MRLSEAIRLGAMLKPQGFHTFFSNKAYGPVHSCALGAAMDAVGTADPRKLWPEVGIYRSFDDIHCPGSGCSMKQKHLGTMVIHLNDDHRWTRERIADWVEQVEPIPETKTEQVESGMATV